MALETAKNDIEIEIWCRHLIVYHLRMRGGMHNRAVLARRRGFPTDLPMVGP